VQRSIFYLDDEASQLEVFRELFGAEFDVRTASTLKEARRVIAECAPDIIISDQKMPEIEGVEFLRESMQACPRSFRILLTGHIGVGEVMEEIRAGVIQAFLAKPWREEEMRARLERASAFLDRQK
jgi:DNA-binding NtrC family response regulator